MKFSLLIHYLFYVMFFGIGVVVILFAKVFSPVFPMAITFFLFVMIAGTAVRRLMDIAAIYDNQFSGFYDRKNWEICFFIFLGLLCGLWYVDVHFDDYWICVCLLALTLIVIVFRKLKRMISR